MPRAIFVQFERERPGQPRQLADGCAVDAAMFAEQLRDAGARAVVINVRYA